MDFSNRQNRFVKIEEVEKCYLEQIYHTTQNDLYYPTYHIATKHGLLNDPNGLCQINGEHHIFYQWFPLGPVHGLKYWYHLGTKDFINYTDYGIALSPDQAYDSHGCYSGSTFIDNEEAYIYYTANQKVDDTFIQTQVVAKMNENKTVTKEKMIIGNHKQHKTCEFRDPIVYKKENEYIMLIGAQTPDEQGVIEMYRSQDLYNFKYDKNLCFSDEHVGYMIECPNYYEEKDFGVLIFSPQGLESSLDNKYDFKNVFSVVYAVGAPIDLEQGKFAHGGIKEIDKGFDFYAPQVYQDEKERRIMIGWLGNSKNPYPTDKSYWAHMLTLPREIKIINEVMHQKVISEFEALKQEVIPLQATHILKQRQCWIELDIEDDFEIKLLNNKNEYLSFCGNVREFILDRAHMTEVYATNFGTVRYAKRCVQNQKIELWIDNSSIEIFCDHGATVFTSRMFIEDLQSIEIRNCKGRLAYLNPINIPYKL